MISQAGIFSAIPSTQINSQTMMLVLLARPPEESGPQPGCRLLLWGAPMTREKRRVLSAILRKAYKMISLTYIYTHFPVYRATSHVD